MDRALCSCMGFVEQYATHIRQVCLEVSSLFPLLERTFFLSTSPRGLGIEHFVSQFAMRRHSWDLHVTSSCHRVKVYSINKTRPATRARMALMEKHGIMSFEPLTRPLEFALESENDYLEKMRKNPREPKN